jgi:SAM-dependent methyltransferase
MEADARNRNVRAHEGLDRIPFPHRTINHLALRSIVTHLKEQGGLAAHNPRVLDVGCGAGFLLQNMLTRGWDAWGIDPNPRGAAMEPPLRERIPGETMESLDGKDFHAITAIEVLEHVEDYTALLLSMYRQLVPGGILVVTVPNDWEFQVEAAPDGSPEPRYGHLWRFRAGDLVTDFEQLGAEAMVTPVYSRALDRRLYRFTRLLPNRFVLRLNDALVRKRHDGAWLLGMVVRGTDEAGSIPHTPKPASALHYSEVDPFARNQKAGTA